MIKKKCDRERWKERKMVKKKKKEIDLKIERMKIERKKNGEREKMRERERALWPDGSTVTESLTKVNARLDARSV